MFILVFHKTAKAYEDSEQLPDTVPVARLDSPADVTEYLTRRDAFAGPSPKCYGAVERAARSIGWIEPDEPEEDIEARFGPDSDYIPNDGMADSRRLQRILEF